MSAVRPLHRSTASPLGGGATEPDWLEGLRRDAWQRWTALGLPNSRDEAWRYTSLAPLTRFRLQPAPHPAPERLRSPRPAAAAAAALSPHRLVFHNGHYVAAWSRAIAPPPGLELDSLARLIANDDPRLPPRLAQLAHPDERSFAALSAALFADGVAIFVASGTRVAAPIELVFINDADDSAIVCPRVLVSAGSDSVVTVSEAHVTASANRAFTNAVTEIWAQPGAEVRHLRRIDGPTVACHVGQTYASVAAGARYHSHLLAGGGALVRDELHVRLDGPGASADVSGLSLARLDTHVDAHTVIDHAGPGAMSRQLYKGIYADTASGVFDGKIIVRPDAQQTDARQTNRNLLLNEGAAAYTRPQLEIYADAVKCAHGATVGQLDDDAIFYLRSRGLDRAAARALLTRAFADEVLAAVPEPALRARATIQLAAWLDAVAGGAS